MHAAVPILWQFTISHYAEKVVMPAQTPYPYPSNLPRDFARAREQFSEHPAFQWARSIYSRHREKSSAIAEETLI